MADFSNIQSAIREAFKGGTATRKGALGSVIAKVAKGLRTQRETKEEAQAGILGKVQTEQIKSLFKPTTQSIVGPTGDVVGTRPTGSVFSPTPNTAARQVLGGIREMRARGDSAADIKEFINFSGFEAKDFGPELAGIAPPAPKKSFLKDFGKDILSKGIGQLFGR